MRDNLPARRRGRGRVTQRADEVAVGDHELLLGVAIDIKRNGVSSVGRLGEAELRHVLRLAQLKGALAVLLHSLQHRHRLVGGEEQQVDLAVLIGIEVEHRIRSLDQRSELYDFVRRRVGRAAIDGEQFHLEVASVLGHHRNARATLKIHQREHGRNRALGNLHRHWKRQGAIHPLRASNHAFFFGEHEDLVARLAVDIAGDDRVELSKTRLRHARLQAAIFLLAIHRDGARSWVGGEHIHQAVAIDIGHRERALAAALG